MSTSGLTYRPIDVIFDSSSTVNQLGSLDAPNYVIYPDLTDIVGMSILWTNVPFTYFVIDDTCNTFVFTETGTGAVSVTATLPPGTYTSSNLQNMLGGIFGVGGVYAAASGT
jgi:hypothetical protein